MPFLGFLSGSLAGKFLGKIGVCIVTTFLLFCTFIISLLLLYDIISTGNIYVISISKWIYVDTLQVDWYFYFDSLTSIMLVVITCISFLVHLYSIEYMREDPHVPRFMSYLSLFTFFMIILVTAGNFLQMFVGWEGVGLSSYLLINFWFNRIQANKSAIKAMLVNRVGDFFLLLAMFLIYYNFDSLDYNIVFTLTPFATEQFYTTPSFTLIEPSIFYEKGYVIESKELPVIDIICIFLLLGAMGKSAQIGLHTWLPDAMEGPTPVSALIHAATMVTAGVFLIVRCSYLFEYSPFALNMAVFIGSFTALFGSSVAIFQRDIKKIIAYSTCSQLGYMIAACGFSGYDVAMFHLYNHAFFKALLFLGAGSIVHSLGDEQDIRKIGGLYYVLPFTSTIMIIGCLALCAYPFTSGFYSKDIILALFYSKQTTLSIFAYTVGLFAAIFTSIYSDILLYKTINSTQSRLSKKIFFNIHEGSWIILVPLIILCILTIFSGYLFKELFIGTGTTFWGSAIFVFPYNYYISEIEFTSTEYKLLSAIIFFVMSFISVGYFNYKKKLEKKVSPVIDEEIPKYVLEKIRKVPPSKNNKLFFVFQTLIFNKYNFDNYYNLYITQNVLYTSLEFVYISLDRGILELIGPHGIVNILNNIVYKVRKLQNGNVITYLGYIIISIITYIIYIFFFHNFFSNFDIKDYTTVFLIIYFRKLIIKRVFYYISKLKSIYFEQKKNILKLIKEYFYKIIELRNKIKNEEDKLIIKIKNLIKK